MNSSATLLRLDYVQISQRLLEAWMSIIMNDVLYLQTRFSVRRVIKDSALVLSAFAVMLILHWPTALFLLILSPILLMCLGRKGEKYRRLLMRGEEVSRYELPCTVIAQRFSSYERREANREISLFNRINEDYYRAIQTVFY